MGKHLTDAQIARIAEDLSLLYSLPYAVDLVGTAWEQILAGAKGGTWTKMRDNRPRPDLAVLEGEKSVNYSVKTEGLRVGGGRTAAADFLGGSEDLIVARPKVDELLTGGQTMKGLSPDRLGTLVLRYYNERIVQQYKWDVLSVLLRVGDKEFIYWEERPVPLYNPKEFWWQESGRATGDNRNINGYPKAVPKGRDLPRAKFKWTSGGKQFYVLYEIPRHADIIRIQRIDLTVEEVKVALRSMLAEKAKRQGIKLPT